jgi:hypothetical protein
MSETTPEPVEPVEPPDTGTEEGNDDESTEESSDDE